VAKFIERPRADGGVSYRVTWVIGGGRSIPAVGRGEPGSQASETFTDCKLMLAFKAAVEAQGHRWQVGWVKGRGWTVDGHETPAPMPAATLDQVYTAWLAAEQQKVALRRKKAKSVGRDDSIYRRVIQPSSGAGRSSRSSVRRSRPGWRR
jgi:hypothetical protein